MIDRFERESVTCWVIFDTHCSRKPLGISDTLVAVTSSEECMMRRSKKKKKWGSSNLKVVLKGKKKMEEFLFL